jgi:hypothetical protein
MLHKSLKSSHLKSKTKLCEYDIVNPLIIILCFIFPLRTELSMSSHITYSNIPFVKPLYIMVAEQEMISV